MTNERPAYETAVRESFARQTMMSSMGVRIVRIGPGEVDLEMPYAAWRKRDIDRTMLSTNVIRQIAGS